MPFSIVSGKTLESINNMKKSLKYVILLLCECIETYIIYTRRVSKKRINTVELSITCTRDSNFKRRKACILIFPTMTTRVVFLLLTVLKVIRESLLKVHKVKLLLINTK